jgi:hypothetical protein
MKEIEQQKGSQKKIKMTRRLSKEEVESKIIS